MIHYRNCGSGIVRACAAHVQFCRPYLDVEDIVHIATYLQRGWERQPRTAYTPLGAGALKSKSRRGFVLPLASRVLICFWLTSCGRGGRHCSSLLSTRATVAARQAT